MMLPAAGRATWHRLQQHAVLHAGTADACIALSVCASAAVRAAILLLLQVLPARKAHKVLLVILASLHLLTLMLIT
jgi:hypothetical protein